MTEILHALSGRVAVVGSGLAGLMTALALAPEPVVLLTRSGIGAGTSTAWAQGGIAASLGADDSADLHLADTLAAGDGLCDADVAAGIVGEAVRAIAKLETMGVLFDRRADGKLALGLEAAHRRHRIVHAGGDGSGAEIVRALSETVTSTPSVTVLEGFDVRRLLTRGGTIAGLLCATPRGAAILPTTRVVLATGGIGGLYDATTNPTANYGQGIALAARAGAKLADMEFVQFHPTALDSRQRPLALVSEAVRGEGATLLNGRNERFMAGVPGAELAPRDVVARAISAEIARGGRVYLDARTAIGARFASRFPGIEALCRKVGVDAAVELIPVRPAAHYHMGGIATDSVGRSSVRGLWVAGEAGSTGLHGANRLASNSLLEAAVMGLRVAGDIGRSSLDPQSCPESKPLPPAGDASVVRPIMSRYLGVLRNGDGLDDAISLLLPMAEGKGAASDPALVGLLVATFAKLRQESRGAHARTDFTEKLAVARRQILTARAVVDIARSLSPHTLARSA
ncbi:L-aspartate oxidase [Rhizobium tubonense]|uniref:L-aspartate oxidase n=1 Tax=Rhizobium tubonense TaxID=484088 RepID=A0A2W4CEC5_9HYPH|nr:L-aspartate oxidase [Rhizobium tubonense]PZM11479.1 L-aspartate oxidase [Rhizobium tubonense]